MKYSWGNKIITNLWIEIILLLKLKILRDLQLQNFFDELGMNESALITADVNLDLMVNMSRGYFLKDGEINLFNSSLIKYVVEIEMYFRQTNLIFNIKL